MALIGRLHPLLIHFPIALVIAAAAAEGAALLTGDDDWRTVAVRNVRAGAGFALFAALAGWRLALTPEMEPSSLLEWHRWHGDEDIVAEQGDHSVQIPGLVRADELRHDRILGG